MVLEDDSIKLIDFGLALNLGEHGISNQMWVYDPFMSPEVLAEQPSASGRESPSHRCQKKLRNTTNYLRGASTII